MVTPGIPDPSLQTSSVQSGHSAAPDRNLSGASLLIDEEGQLIWASDEAIPILQQLLPHDRRMAETRTIPATTPPGWIETFRSLRAGHRERASLRSPDRPVSASLQLIGPHRRGLMVAITPGARQEDRDVRDRAAMIAAMPVPAVLLNRAGQPVASNDEAEELGWGLAVLEGHAGRLVDGETIVVSGRSAFVRRGTATPEGLSVVVLDESAPALEQAASEVSALVSGRLEHEPEPGPGSSPALVAAMRTARVRTGREQERIDRALDRLAAQVGGTETGIETAGWAAVAERIEGLVGRMELNDSSRRSDARLLDEERERTVQARLLEAEVLSDTVSRLGSEAEALLTRVLSATTEDEDASGGVETLLNEVGREAGATREALDRFLAGLDAWLERHRQMPELIEGLDEIAYESSLLALQTSTQAALQRDATTTGLSDSWRALSTRLGESARDVRCRLHEDLRRMDEVLREARGPMAATDRIAELATTDLQVTDSGRLDPETRRKLARRLDELRIAHEDLRLKIRDGLDAQTELGRAAQGDARIGTQVAEG